MSEQLTATISASDRRSSRDISRTVGHRLRKAAPLEQRLHLAACGAESGGRANQILREDRIPVLTPAVAEPRDVERFDGGIDPGEERVACCAGRLLHGLFRAGAQLGRKRRIVAEKEPAGAVLASQAPGRLAEAGG